MAGRWWSCVAVSRVGRRSVISPVQRPAVIRRSLCCATLSLLPLLGGGWVWAQIAPDGAPEAGSAQPLRPGALPSPNQVVPPPLPGAGSAGTPGPIRVDPSQLQALPAPRRFDQSLNELVQDGVVTPGERSRIRGGNAASLHPFDVAAFQRACSSGALSQQECRGGVAIRWGRRQAGGDPSLANGRGTGVLGPDGTPLPPLTVPVSALLAGQGGSFNLASVFRVTPRPAPILGNGNRRLLLPILGAAEPSSGFGWRLHPLLGIWRMHAGEDLAAPEGTPVVAALSGRVVSSGLAGGYGLAVEIEHQRPLRRTLYGHLSELFVQSGEWVRQGEVVGRVGSTGLSTGPHLHFELRQPADGGWVAVDPGELDSGRGRPGGPDALAVLFGQLLASLQRPSS